jgi:hypothetical protein
LGSAADVPIEDAAASSNDRYERLLLADGDRQPAVRSGREWADCDDRQHASRNAKTSEVVGEERIGEVNDRSVQLLVDDRGTLARRRVAPEIGDGQAEMKHGEGYVGGSDIGAAGSTTC